MNKSSFEILLIHTVSSPTIRYGRLIKAAGRTAPFGLACLAAAFADRVAVVDLQHHTAESADNIESMLIGALSNICALDAVSPRAVVVQAASDWTEEDSATLANVLRQRFPQAMLILGGRIRRQFAPHWNIQLLGTGRYLLEELLNGTKTFGWSGLIETLQEDLKKALPVPELPLADASNYFSSAEKHICGRTVSVYQPWLGLLDRTENLGVRPPSDFLNAFIPWLQRSGFNAAAFASPVWPAAVYEELQEICSRLHFPFSLTVADPDEAAAIATLPTGFLDRLWLFPGDNKDLLESFSAIAPRFGDLEVCLGLRLRSDLANASALEELLAFCGHLSIKLPQEWNPAILRRLLIDFYLRKGRLWRHLWRLSSARDLLNFMRGAYGIFDLLFHH